jgi:hypothetical protein
MPPRRAMTIARSASSNRSRAPIRASVPGQQMLMASLARQGKNHHLRFTLIIQLRP